MVPSAAPSIPARNNGGRRLPEEREQVESRATQGDSRDMIRLREDLTATQLDIEITRMRENGYELAEGLQLRTGDDSPPRRTGNFRRLGTGRRRAA